MELMVCIDGAEHATIPLKDGADGFNLVAERGALDRAYEAKESNPDSVVTIVVCGDEPESQWADVSDTEFIAENLGYLASIDEGEHTDSDRLHSLAKALAAGALVVTPVTADAPTEG